MILRAVNQGVTLPAGVWLAPGVALVALSGTDGDGVGMRVGGCVPRPPYGTVTIEREPAPRRLAAVVFPVDQPLLIEGPNGLYVSLLPSELEMDPLSMVADLEPASRWLLLDFLLNFCCAAFRLGRSAPFASVCARLARGSLRDAGIATVEAQVLPERFLLDGMDVSDGSTLCVIGRGSVVHSSTPVLRTGRLQILPPVRTGDLIVATGTDPAVWVVHEPGATPHLLALREEGRVSGMLARGACRAALGGGGQAGQRTQLLREMDVLYPAPARKIDDPAQPIGGEVELAVPDGRGGMFVTGWLRDPLDMIGELALTTEFGEVPLTPESLIRVRRPDIAKRFATATHRGAEADHGFVGYLPDMPGSHTAQPRVSLLLRSGSRVQLTPAPRSMSPEAARDTVLGCLPPSLLTPKLMRQCIAPAVARLHSQAIQAREQPETVQIGQQIAKPIVSVLIPLYRNMSFLRFQLARFAEDPQCHRGEIIYILDSPEQRNEVEHLLRGLHLLTDLPVTLVIMPRNAGYAAATNAGANVARAPFLLLLNSDVVPIAPGWLRPLLAPFESPEIGITGPKLLFEDESIQHAGLYFERDADGIWFNRHYHKGMPRDWRGARTRREVPGVTGAALVIRRPVFDRAGGVCEDYIVGDYEDSDLCLRARAAGASIAYVPSAELFHFERRSIMLHAGYTRTFAALYNRLLHHDRWDAAIATLMARLKPVRRSRA